jgi:hypothetical protein
MRPAGGKAGKTMDARVEAFLADVLALEGEKANTIREGVRIALADYEQIFRAQEVNKRMKDKAAHAFRVLSRARVVEEMRSRRGTSTVEHLKIVLSVIDGPVQFPLKDERHYPPPWSIEEHNNACFIVKDADGQALAHVYFEDEAGRRSAAKLLTRDEARRIAANIAKLPELLRQPKP